MSVIYENEIKSMTKEQNYMRGYVDGRTDALDKIRAEITDRPSLMMATSEEYERGVNAMLYQALSIIDKYREVKE